MVEVELGVEPLLDAGLAEDLLHRHRRPAVGRVADQVLVAARPLALVDADGFQTRHHAETLAHRQRRIRRHGRARLGRRGLAGPDPAPALHAADELEHLVVLRVKDHHEIVVAELADLGEPGPGAVPPILVVEHHGLPQERFQLGHAVRGLDDVVVAVARVVRVVREEVIGEVLRVRQDLAHGGLDGGQLGAGALLVTEDVEQDPGDLVFGALVPGRRQRPVAALDGRRHLGPLPELEHREEDVVAVARDVAPAGGVPLVHRHRVAVDPEEVERQVAEHLVPSTIGS